MSPVLQRARVLLLAIAVAALLLPGAAGVALAADGVGACNLAGAGTEGSPFQVATAAELGCIAGSTAYLGSHLHQTASIALTDTWSHGIGNDVTPFTGTYDGGGFTISGLHLVVDTSYQGLFGYTSGATISNLVVTGLIESAPVGGASWIGGVVGYAAGTTIEWVSSFVQITATAVTASGIGTLVGGMDDVAPSSLTQVHADADLLATVTHGTSENVGGLVGVAFAGTITDASVSGTAAVHLAPDSATTSTTMMNMGGLVGYASNVAITGASSSCVTAVVATAATSKSHLDYMGGLVGGMLNGSVTDARSSGLVTANIHGWVDDVGGLVGNSWNTDVTRARASSDVVAASSSSSVDAVGGLAGLVNGGTYSQVVAIGTVTAMSDTGMTRLGGLVGAMALADATAPVLADAYSFGSVGGTGTNPATQAGGLVGSVEAGQVNRTYTVSPVTVAGGGALIGASAGAPAVTIASSSFFNTDTALVTTGVGANDLPQVVGLPAGSLVARATYASGGTYLTTTWTSAWPIAASWADPADPGTTDAWGICPSVNGGNPFLLWEYGANPCIRTLTITPPAHGSITDGASLTCPDTCSATYDWATPVTLTATPAPGYRVVWGAPCEAAPANVCDVTMFSDTSMVPSFALLPSFTKPATVAITTGGALPATPGTVKVTVSWAAMAGDAPLKAVAIYRSVNGAPFTDTFEAVLSSSASSYTTTVPTTGTVRFRVGVVDMANGATASDTAVVAPRLTQQAPTAKLAYTGTWANASGTGYSGGSLRWSKAAGATAVFRFTGSSFAIVSGRAALRGKVVVYVDTVKKATLDLRGATLNRLVAWRWIGPKAGHIVKIVVLGTAGRPRVDLDAFVTLQ